MKVFQLHVGNKAKKDPTLPEDYYLQRISFEDSKFRYYLKQDIVNADNQMQSIIRKGVKVEYGHFSERKSILSLIKGGFKLRKICKEKEIDLVHTFWGATTAFMAILFSPCPVVISFCGSDLMGNVSSNGKYSISGKISTLLSQLSAIGAIKIITKSEQMRSVLWSISRHKTVVIPNGLDLTLFKPQKRDEARKIIGWALKKKIIIFFDGMGALVKNLSLAKKIYAEVCNEIPCVEFKILNKIPHEKLVYYYNAADVMLLTSFHEGSNNSLKEAMACNLPVVSVDVGDARERLSNVQNSFVVNTYDAKELAKYVISVLLNDNRSNGSKFSKEVSINNIADKVIKVYDSILDKTSW